MPETKDEKGCGNCLSCKIEERFEWEIENDENFRKVYEKAPEEGKKFMRDLFCGAYDRAIRDIIEGNHIFAPGGFAEQYGILRHEVTNQMVNNMIKEKMN